MIAKRSYYSVAETKPELGERGCVYATTRFKGTPEWSHNIAVAVMRTAHDTCRDHTRTFVTQCVQKMHDDQCTLCVCWLPGEASRYEALFAKRHVGIFLHMLNDRNAATTLPIYIAVLNAVVDYRRQRITTRTLSEDEERAFQKHLLPLGDVLGLTDKGSMNREQPKVCKDEAEASDPDDSFLSVSQAMHNPPFD